MKRWRRTKPKKSRRDRSPIPVVKTVLASLTVGVLGLWAMLPFGGAAAWAADSILLSAMSAAIVLWALALWPKRNTRFPVKAREPAPGSPADGNANPEDDSRLLRPASCSPWKRLGMTGRGSIGYLGIVLLLMTAWAFLQLLPLPAVTVMRLQPGWKILLDGFDDAPAKLSMALDGVRSFYAVLLWLALGVTAGAIAVCFRDRHAARVLAHLIAALGALQAFSALVIPGLESSWWDTVSSNRLLGTFPNPNAFGGFLALTAPVTLGLLLSLQNRLVEAVGGRWKRLLALPSQHHGLLVEWIWIFLCLLAQVVTLIGCGSRGAVSATLVPASVLFAIYIFSVKSRRGMALQTAGMLLLAVFLIAAGGGFALLMERFQTEALWDRGLPGRTILWKATIRMIAAFPMGVGAGSFSRVFTTFQPPGFGANRLYYAHNDYLQWTGEFGVPGLVLLVALTAGLLRRMLATASLPNVRDSAWIWRGAATAIAATLAHAVVDFNMTVYPGVRTMFFIVCGLLLGAPREKRADERPARAQKNAGTQIKRTIVFAILVTAAVAAGVPVLKNMLTARRAEGARRSLDLPANLVFWNNPPWVHPEKAMDVLNAARDGMPGKAHLRYWTATGKLADFNRRRRNAVENMIAEYDLYSAADVRQAEQMVDLAMRWEFRETLEFAREQLEHAVALAPWNADMRALIAYVSASLAEWEGAGQTGARHRREAVSHIQGALRLAPNDYTVLVELCRAAARLHAAAVAAQDTDAGAFAAQTLETVGRQAVDIDVNATVIVMAAWETADMLAEKLVDLDDLPLPVLQEVYAYFSGNYDAGQATRTLEQLEVRYIADSIEPNDRKRLFVARETYRWMIWQRQWDAYNEAAPKRRAIWMQNQDGVLDENRQAGRPEAAMRMIMRTVDRNIGLNPRNLLELSRLEWERGDKDAVISLLARALALGGAGNDAPDAEIMAFESWRKNVDAGSDRYAVIWLEARLLRNDGQMRSAALRYNRLLNHPRLPLRLRNRIRIEAAEAWRDAGDQAAAAALISSALRDSPDDPDVLQAVADAGDGYTVFRGPEGFETSAMERLETLKPQARLGTRFMGQKIELVGLTIEPYGFARTGGARLRMYFRFFDKVPADLAVRVVVRDEDDFMFFGRMFRFAQEIPRQFSAGEPYAGSVVTLDAILPPQAQAGNKLKLSLWSQRKRLTSEEGLSRIEIGDWRRL